MVTIHGLTKRTKAQKEADIDYLSKKPIREIWEKQALVKSQQIYIYNLYTKSLKSHNYKEAERLELESAELAELENDLKEAVRRK